MMPDIKAGPREALNKHHLTLKQAAEWYGVSERTLRRRVSEGQLAAVRVGPRSIRVKAEDVEALGVPIPTAAAS